MAATGLQTTKGLYFTFTLLCLVCLARSLMSKDELEKLKLNIKQIQQQQDISKVELESLAPNLGFIDDHLNMMEKLQVWVKKNDLPDDFPPVDELLQKTKDFTEKVKTDIGRKNEEFGEQIEKNDEKVRHMMKFIEFLEENQAEL